MLENESDSPLVSVCMITYNHRAFIKRAIRSVLNQKTDFPFELVIGEDFSTDGTREIVLEFANRYPEIITIIPHTQNVGSQQNEDKTERHCKGDYIAYCEGDDFWHDERKLQLQVNALKDDPSIGLVFSDYDRFYAESGVTKKAYNAATNNYPPRELNPELIVKGGSSLYILTCTVMIRTSLLRTIIDGDPYLFSRSDIRVRDTSVWAEAAALSRLKYLPLSLATYTVNSESASKSCSRIKRIRFATEVYDIALYLARKHGFTKETRRELQTKWSRAAIRLAMHQSSRVDIEKAWHSLPKPAASGLDHLIFRLRKHPAFLRLAGWLDRRFSRY